jgi:hypothetical protein
MGEADDATPTPGGSRKPTAGDDAAGEQPALLAIPLQGLSCGERWALYERSLKSLSIAKELADTGRLPPVFSTKAVHKRLTQAKGGDRLIIIPPADDPAVLNLAILTCSCWVMANFEAHHPTLANNRLALASLATLRDRAIPQGCKDLEKLVGLDVGVVEECISAAAALDAALRKLRDSVPKRSQIALVTPVSWQLFALHLTKGFGDAVMRQGGGNGPAIKRAMYRFIAAVMPDLNDETPSVEAIRTHVERKRSVRTEKTEIR